MLMNMMLHVVESTGKAVHFFSYEEHHKQLVMKTLNVYTARKKAPVKAENNRKALADYFATGNLPSGASKDFKFHEDRFFDEYVHSGRIAIHSESMPVEDLVMVIKHLNEKSDVAAVFIDYIQCLYLTKNTRNTRQEELKEVCFKLKDCAVETGLPLIFGAQFNRDVNSSKELFATSIREAGDIEQIANLIIGCWNMMKEEKGSKDFQPSNELFCKILKNRDGESDRTFKLDFDGNTGMIMNP